ncbi:hypothetical protein EB796_024526 [Bugula neritina]|uniref:Uncharacterized protein n=1 Tax=Bugula neritina TaxID=10212 RepID=A0A7J7ITC5_BUGNE|nr:hypothetical protein EB796_024526 [Bugula neritina]
MLQNLQFVLPVKTCVSVFRHTSLIPAAQPLHGMCTSGLANTAPRMNMELQLIRQLSSTHTTMMDQSSTEKCRLTSLHSSSPTLTSWCK